MPDAYSATELLVGVRLAGGSILSIVDNADLGASLRASLASVVRAAPSAVKVELLIESPSGLTFIVPPQDAMNSLSSARRVEEEAEGQGDHKEAFDDSPSPRRRLQDAPSGPFSGIFVTLSVDFTHPSVAAQYSGATLAQIATSMNSLVTSTFSSPSQLTNKFGSFLGSWATATGQGGASLTSLMGLRAVRLPAGPSASPVPPAVPLSQQGGFVGAVGAVLAILVVGGAVLAVPSLRFALLYRLHISMGWEAAGGKGASRIDIAGMHGAAAEGGRVKVGGHNDAAHVSFGGSPTSSGPSQSKPGAGPALIIRRADPVARVGVMG
jgi:hypothetical protein